MRALIPSRLVVVGESVWAVDVSQPVAAVLDPTGGRAPRVVGWAAVAPAPVDAGWPRALHASDEGLFVQEAPGGAVARVAAEGDASVFWSDGCRLEAAGPDSAWLVPEGRVEWAVPVVEAGDLGLEGTAFGPDDLGLPARMGVPSSFLLRCAADGVRQVAVEGEIVSVRSGPDGLDVEVDPVGEMSRLDLADMFEAMEFDSVPETRWLRLPWGEPLPDVLDGEYEIPVDFVAPEPWDADGLVPDVCQGRGFWQEPLRHAGLRWRAGWVRCDVTGPDDAGGGPGDGPDPSVWSAGVAPGPMDVPGTSPSDLPGAPSGRVGRPGVPGEEPDLLDEPAAWERFPVAVVAHDERGRFVRRWDLGEGAVSSMVPVDGGVVVVLDRGTPGRPGPAEVVVVRDGQEPRRLLGEVDVTAWCRPLVPRPPEVDSYLAQVPARYGVPDVDGVEDAQAQVEGDWPHARLVWTFTHRSRPGVTLRRRFDLFDEIGRLTGGTDVVDPAPLALAAAHLLDDLATDALPPIDHAVDGILDV